MEVQRLATYPLASYPDRDAALRDPSLLLATPKRWKRNAAACAALAATSAMLMTACGDEGRVPVFDRGRGLYQYEFNPNVIGKVAPPFYITEDIAFRLICEEAEKQGVHFKRTFRVLDDVKLPGKGAALNQDTHENPGGLELDGYDEEKNIAFEYVSLDDSDLWNTGSQVQTGDTVTVTRDMRNDAKALRDGLKGNTGDTLVAVFYDPQDNLSKDDSLENAKANLKEQVRDFITWLKSQGII